MTVEHQLQGFIQRALALTDHGCFYSPYDPDWPSACELADERDGELIGWRPVAQDPAMQFAGLANALEVPIHADICAFFSSYWSGSLEACTEDGHVSLMQLWNPEDFDRLIENFIGHSLAKRRQRQPYTLFFANTEPDSELFLSVDNETGQVLLEEPGRKPLRKVADNLASFLEQLTPVNTTPGIY